VGVPWSIIVPSPNWSLLLFFQRNDWPALPLNEAVEEARRSFVASLEVSSVELAALERDGAPEHREPLRRLAHRIAGTAGTYELHALSALARRVQDACEGGAGAEALRTHIQALRRAVDELFSS
jgi:HPt (histidine-containing phosphotransfer) domain-containing protein